MRLILSSSEKRLRRHLTEGLTEDFSQRDQLTDAVAARVPGSSEGKALDGLAHKLDSRARKPDGLVRKESTQKEGSRVGSSGWNWGHKTACSQLAPRSPPIVLRFLL